MLISYNNLGKKSIKYDHVQFLKKGMFQRNGVGRGGKDIELRQRGMTCVVDLRKDTGVRKNKEDLKQFSRITAVSS